MGMQYRGSVIAMVMQNRGKIIDMVMHGDIDDKLIITVVKYICNYVSIEK